MNQRVFNLAQTKWFIPTSVGVAAFAGGLGLGYFLGKRKASEPVEESTPYSQLVIPFDKGTIRDILTNKAQEASQQNHPSNISVDKPTVRLLEQVTDESEEEDEEAINVFTSEDSDWNYEHELSTRTPDNPYIIHQDEFFADEMGYTQTTLTYYNEDDILVDEMDVPIYGYPNVVGTLSFGHGSRDENVVYVRNERLHTEYEVLFGDGSYEIEVLGLQREREFEAEDLKHSNHKFKME